MKHGTKSTFTPLHLLFLLSEICRLFSTKEELLVTQIIFAMMYTGKCTFMALYCSSGHGHMYCPILHTNLEQFHEQIVQLINILWYLTLCPCYNTPACFQINLKPSASTPRLLLNKHLRQDQLPSFKLWLFKWRTPRSTEQQYIQLDFQIKSCWQKRNTYYDTLWLLNSYSFGHSLVRFGKKSYFWLKH